MNYPCGCINGIESESGILRCVKKCNFHINWSLTHPEGESLEYFRDLNAIRDGVPQNDHLARELVGALSISDMAYLADGWRKSLLEIGCGLGAYIPLFLSNHWNYLAIEQADFCVNWVQQTFYIAVRKMPIEEFLKTAPVFNCIFAAHVFEHLKDAPAVLKTCYEKVDERLYLIVPDDEDPTNPDHRWFFTQESLHRLLERIGFVNVRSQIRKLIPQESFIYCVAEK
jgi:hypothetical protein